MKHLEGSQTHLGHDELIPVRTKESLAELGFVDGIDSLKRAPEDLQKRNAIRSYAARARKVVTHLI